MISLLFYVLSIVQPTGWNLLSEVKLQQGYDEFMGGEIDQPVFSDNLFDKEGEEITLEGFVIPMDAQQTAGYFVLSRFPYQSCFFCGAAGPETVVEVFSKTIVNRIDQKVRVKGRLVLNRDNPLHLFYILQDCTVVRID